ncbi:MAG: PTS sugar transporter subunit IIA [Fusobacteriaceae bacterium]|jgi:PTS system fructose-specific IIC component|nr:PTS sugar transporter subunit IIA [Fusobacteriaceae bacterium]MBP6466457.1 PTS sugar transporter subunit IIA [Fusobacteriaceae bacterium]MBP9596956.1 PTS sugar transporter subunit IIA [Fusobacteriaceae bacterium]MBU9918662.1 fructose-specific PTS transporter subunit EIIC [Fusobacteriaceae bacterium]
MDIKSFMSESLINVDLKATSKVGIIEELSSLFEKSDKITDLEGFRKALLEREAISSTALESGIAVPHCKSSTVKEISIAFGLHKTGVEYDSMDGEPSQLFFMIAAPDGTADAHVECLAELTKYLLDDNFRDELLQVKSAKEVLALLERGILEDMGENNKNEFYIAVTACPTGIAHTYMSAESLNKGAKDLGVEIKVETNGSAGVKNPLTAEDIKRAVGVIIAADKNVEMDRFDGKKLIMTGTKAAIKDPKGLIQQVKTADVYRSGKKATSGGAKERTGFYKHLMSGVSNMLPFVVGGGILIAICFMFGIKSFMPDDPSFSPIAKFLMDVGGGGAFGLMVPILAGFIGLSIADRPGFMPAMVAGVMANQAGGGFLGGLIGGFVGGYVVLGLKKAFAGLPETLEGIKPVLLYPLFGLLLTGIAMKGILIPVVSINNAMSGFLNGLGTGNLVVLGIILGGMMAVDMGGPVNKAAFAFGIAAIASGNNAPHAAVMAGGMVPPLAIALSTTFFKKKYDEEERKAGLTNYIMGASFITEGAIPFAAADPVRVIPSLIVASALAGGLAMLFGCELPAPHGGLFVIPLVKNAGMYVVSILVGSVVGAVLLGVLKKDKA